MSQRLQQLGQDAESIRQRLAALEQETAVAKTRFEALEAFRLESTADRKGMRELLKGVYDTVDGIANSLTLDQPLQDEIRTFLEEQRAVRKAREEADAAEAIRRKAVEDEARESRKEQRRILQGILATVLVAIGTFLVRQASPSIGGLIDPLAIGVFIVGVLALGWLSLHKVAIH